MGSEKRAMPNASGLKARPVKPMAKKTAIRWNLSAGMERINQNQSQIKSLGLSPQTNHSH
jgi:hypothetical protein